MPRDVFFFEAFEEEAACLRELLPAGLEAGFTRKTIQEAARELSPTGGEPPARIVSTRTQSVIPPEWAGKVDGVLTRSTGYDHVLEFLRAAGEAARGTCAGYLPRYCARAVAEHAMMVWTALLRKLPRQLAQFGGFLRDGLTGRECLGKTVLVVGVGNIGGEVVKIARALGMRPVGCDIVRRHDFVEYASYDEAAPEADVIVCAMNLTAENTGYFDRATLARAKRGAVFVNVARGELSPPADLLDLLEEGRLGGVGLDVYDRESELAVALREGGASGDRITSDKTARLAATLALARRDDAILTPHNAFNTAEALRRKADRTVESVVAFLERGEFPDPLPACGEGGRPCT